MPALVVLADADPLSRMDWEVVLRGQGYLVIAVDSGERLLDSCAHIQPDLVLINASSPEICGPELCSRLKADPRNRLTSVILITGLSVDSESIPSPETSADDWWQGLPSRWDALSRIQSLLHMKSYIDEQAVSVLTSLVLSIEGRNPYLRGHCERVSALAVQFGRSLDLDARDLEALRIAASIHDIGKVMLPDSILLKPGWLTLVESRIMEQHPIEGERICAPMKSLRDVLPIIRYHHERMDGSGYPDGLRRSLIPYLARVLQIVDIYDALTTDRSYRRSVSVPKALTMLSAEADRGLLGKDLVDHFASLMVARPMSIAIARSANSEISRLA